MIYYNLPTTKYLFAFIILFTNIWISAQEKVEINEITAQKQPSIPIEGLFGNERIEFRSVFDKPFTPGSKLGFFFNTALMSDYETGREAAKEADMMVHLALSYSLAKGLNAHAGYAINSTWGTRYFGGVVYVNSFKGIQYLIAPSVYFSNTQYYEILASLEYKPKLNDKWSLFTQVKGLYSYDFNNSVHDRSFINTRLGVTYKTITFGAGYNYDAYGPGKLTVNNAGVFIQTFVF